MATPDNPRARFPRKAKIAVTAIVIALLVMLLAAGAFPVGLLKGVAKHPHKDKLKNPVTINSH